MIIRRLSHRALTREHIAVPSLSSRYIFSSYRRRLFSSTPLNFIMAAVAEITVPVTGKKIRVPTGLFINNQFVPSVDSKETIEYVPPAFW